MSGSSIVSSPSLEEGGFNLPRETSVALRLKDEVGGTSTAAPTTGGPGGGGATVVGAPPPGAGKPGVAMVPPPPVFCATLREPLTHKAAVYYHQQLALQEDQGIDLTQSPGRDSPGSSSGSAGSGSRHSTASLDSGRASSYLTGVSSSGASIRAPLSSPRCSSVSSCSIGSVDRQRNDELIIDWLLEMKHEEYAQLFIAAGYDLPTIARMTPEDLTAIGIKNPHHRERIKQRIDKLQVLDNLPHFVPVSKSLKRIVKGVLETLNGLYLFTIKSRVPEKYLCLLARPANICLSNQYRTSSTRDAPYGTVETFRWTRLQLLSN